MPKKSVRNRKRKHGFFQIAFLSLGSIAIALLIAIVLSSYIQNTRERQKEADLAIEAAAVDVESGGTSDGQMVIAHNSFFQADEEIVVEEVAATPTPVPEPTYNPDEPYALVRPTVAPYAYLPVFTKANTDELKIAITIDECSGTTITRNFCEAAILKGAKLTLFPVGSYFTAEGAGTFYRSVIHDYGFEVENRGMGEMTRVYRLNDAELLEEIWQQNADFNYILGEKYEMHFFRSFGAVAIDDPHLQYILQQLGYIGTVGWTYVGTDLSADTMKETLAPGNIYYYKSTNGDLEKMNELIDYAVSEGYQIVTLNELFGYSENATEASDDLIFGQKMPEIEEYSPLLYLIKDGECSYAVYRMQNRLIELGYMDGTADGVFGSDTSTALRLFQAACGMAATGLADVNTQTLLYEDDAPHYAAEKLYQ